MKSVRSIIKSIRNNFTRRKKTPSPPPSPPIIEKSIPEPLPIVEKSIKSIEDQVNEFNESNPHTLLSIESKKNNLIKIVPTHHSDICAEFTIESKTQIYLDELSKCTGFTGTKVLHIVEQFAKNNGYKKITLSDASEIQSDVEYRSESLGYGRCVIPLIFINILATGETWYNSRGYISSKQFEMGFEMGGKKNGTEIEKEHNQRIIQQPCKQYISDLCESVGYDENKTNEFINGMKYFMKSGQDPETITIQELFSQIKTKMKEDTKLDCNNKKHNWVVNIIHFLFNVACKFIETKSDIKRINTDYKNTFILFRTNVVKPI